MNILDNDFIELIKKDILSDLEDNKLRENLNINMQTLNPHQSALGNSLGTVLTTGAVVPGGIIGGIVGFLSSKDTKKLKNAQKEFEKQLKQRIKEAQKSIERQIALEQEKQSKRLEESLDAHLGQISDQINQIKQLLKSVSYSSDMIINSMGVANQKTTRDIIETQNLIKSYMELLRSTSPDKDSKLKEFVEGLPKEVFISIISDVIKKLLGTP